MRLNGSNVRAFKEKGFVNSRGLLLSRDEFVLCRELEGRGFEEEVGRTIVSLAEPMLEEEIPLLPLSSYRDYFLTGVRSRFEKHHHRRQEMLRILTLAEAYERQGRFMEKLCDVIWAILEETTWVIPAHYHTSVLDPKTQIPEVYTESQMPGLDLYAAGSCSHLALAKYYLKDELDKISPVICKRIDHQVYLRGVRPFATVPFWWSGFGGGRICNWLTNITQNILITTAICTEDMALRERVVDRAMSYLDNFTADYSADGYCDEGPGYWSAAPGNYFDCLEIIEDMSGGKITVYDNPLVKKMGEYACSLHIGGQDFACIGDCSPTMNYPGKMIVRYGRKCHSVALESFGRAMAIREVVDEDSINGFLYRNVKDAMTPRPCDADPSVYGNSATWFGDGRLAVLREKSVNGEGFYLAFKGGNNNESHNHNDVGVIIVYKDGKPLIVDPSIGSYDHEYFGSYRYKRWFTNSDFHSLPSFGGTVQCCGQQFASRDEVFDGEGKSCEMELAGAYPASLGLTSLVRRCEMGEGYVTVTDAVSLKEEGEISFNYTLYNEPRIISDGRIDIGGATLEYDPVRIEAVTERIENKFLPYEDLDFKAKWGVSCLWRLVLRTRGREVTLSVRIS